MHTFANNLNKNTFDMKGKLERQRLIKQIVKEMKIASQEELSTVLEGKGLNVAQATLSRDIRELGIMKLHDANGYYYNLPSSSFPKSLPSNVSVSDSIISIEMSGHLTVIKTRPGHADMIASVIDDSAVKPIMGTIAGDDTIMMAVREGFSHQDVLYSLSSIFKGLQGKLI